MDIKDALQHLASQAEQAAKPQRIDTQDPRVERWAIGGEVHEFALHNPRLHAVERVASIIMAANQYASGTGTIYHNDRAVVLVVNDSGDQADLDQVELLLVHSGPFMLLRQLGCGDPRAWGHRDFIRLLQNEMAGVFPPTLLDAVRQLRVTAQGAKESEVSAGRERGTSEFRRELAQADQLPTEVLATLPVYEVADLASVQQVQCSLELDLDRLQFVLRPLELSLVAARDAAQDQLHSDLEAAGCPLYYGSPE